MNDRSAGHVELPRTAYLDHTLRRARTAAEQRSHRYVTLEHLLLALLDDPDALKLLQGAGADVAVIRSSVADAVNNRMASLVVPDGRPPNFSYKFDSLFVGASEDAARMGLREIDGALTLVAIAKEPESNASVILIANGFNPQAALQAIWTPPQPAPQRPETPSSPRQEAFARNPQSQQPASGASPRAHAAPEASSFAVSGESMEDMMASVRNILEAEERKEGRLPPRDFPPVPRAEPQRTNGSAQRERPPEAVRRAEPGFGQAAPAQAVAYAGAPGGFAEAPAPAFDLEKPPKPEKRAAQGRNAPRGKAASLGLLTKILEQIPRKVRLAVPETIQLSLSKEEAGLIFGWLSRKAPPQQGPEAEIACRAVTIRLTAPEGGFFIEALRPETQWILDRPAFLGEEAFGTWTWAAVPNDSGSYPLNVSMSARGVDANGLAADINLPDQAIEVYVRGNFWRGLGRLIRTALLLLAGSGLTVAVYQALKIAGKLSH